MMCLDADDYCPFEGRPPREPERRARILLKLSLLWEVYPDFRLGQLLEVLRQTSALPMLDMFYYEDDSLEKALDGVIALEREAGNIK